MTLKVFFILEDEELLALLDKMFSTSDAHGYSKCFEALFMKPKVFVRSDVENYVTNLSNALIQNLNFENPHVHTKSDQRHDCRRYQIRV